MASLEMSRKMRSVLVFALVCTVVHCVDDTGDYDFLYEDFGTDDANLNVSIESGPNRSNDSDASTFVDYDPSNDYLEEDYLAHLPTFQGLGNSQAVELLPRDTAELLATELDVEKVSQTISEQGGVRGDLKKGGGLPSAGRQIAGRTFAGRTFADRDICRSRHLPIATFADRDICRVKFCRSRHLPVATCCNQSRHLPVKHLPVATCCRSRHSKTVATFARSGLLITLN